MLILILAGGALILAIWSLVRALLTPAVVAIMLLAVLAIIEHAGALGIHGAG